LTASSNPSLSRLFVLEPTSSAGPANGPSRSWARGIALFLGGFALLNVLGGFRSAGFDANLWWIDLRWLPAALGHGFLLLSALCLVAFAVRPAGSGWRRSLSLFCTAGLGLLSLVNVVQFYVLLARGAIKAGLPVPLALLVCVAAAGVFAGMRQAVAPASWKGLPSVVAVCLACMVAFPLAQMFCFGKTDYRRAADVAVVLGARVYADGWPSDALADRVRTACALYRQGLVPKLLFSGGPGDGAVHETESMKHMALQLGVRAQDILLDKGGLNTQATVRNTETLFQDVHASRVLVVSHFYHLPRIKLAYQRDGLDVYTVPAKESYLLRQLPFNIAREVVALWVYYLRPITAGSAHQ
jgi:vancomycin permeability regulator SanA